MSISLDVSWQGGVPLFTREQARNHQAYGAGTHAERDHLGSWRRGTVGAMPGDADKREKGIHNVNMRGRGRAFGRNTTVVGPSDVYESNEMLVIWRSDTVAEEAKLRTGQAQTGGIQRRTGRSRPVARRTIAS